MARSLAILITCWASWSACDKTPAEHKRRRPTAKVSKAPSSTRVMRLGKRAERARDWEEALKHYRRAKELGAPVKRVNASIERAKAERLTASTIAKAIKLRSKGEFAAAKVALQSIERSSVYFAEARRLSAAIGVQQQQASDTSDAGLNPLSNDQLLMNAERMWRQKDYEQTLALAQRVLARDKDNTGARVFAGRAACQLKKKAIAIKVVQGMKKGFKQVVIRACAKQGIRIK